MKGHIEGLRSRLARLPRKRRYLYGGSVILLLVTAVAVGLVATHGRPAPAARPAAVRPKLQPVPHPAGPTPDKAAAPAGPAVLFSDPLNGSDRIVTNEFTHFSPGSGCPYTSDKWIMTSGTLLIHNGAGYSGVPTIEDQSVCDSATHTNSAVFRLITRPANFANMTVSLDYDAVAHGGDGAPDNSYDGLHIWVGYQNEYALYAATIFRWDGNLVIKKKVPQQQAGCTDPSNSGCYYDLTDETIRRDITTPNVWHHADISLQTNANRTITLIERIDGQVILQGTDNNVHGSVYQTGAVGVRGDNTEFYFKNFTITQP